MKRQPSAAKTLVRQIKRTPRKGPQPIVSASEQMVARRLESRGITGPVPGMPVPVEESEDERRSRALADLAEWYRYLNSGQYEVDREARRQAEEAAKEAPPTTAGMLAAAIKAQAGSPANGAGSSAIPLNGAAVIRAAIAGGNGTVNGA